MESRRVFLRGSPNHPKKVAKNHLPGVLFLEKIKKECATASVARIGKSKSMERRDTSRKSYKSCSVLSKKIAIRIYKYRDIHV